MRGLTFCIASRPEKMSFEGGCPREGWRGAGGGFGRVSRLLSHSGDGNSVVEQEEMRTSSRLEWIANPTYNPQYLVNPPPHATPRPSLRCQRLPRHVCCTWPSATRGPPNPLYKTATSQVFFFLFYFLALAGVRVPSSSDVPLHGMRQPLRSASQVHAHQTNRQGGVRRGVFGAKRRDGKGVSQQENTGGPRTGGVHPLSLFFFCLF